MSEHEHESGNDRELAAELRLRPERPPVTRLSRRVLMGLAAVAGISVSGALIWALNQGQRKTNSATEPYNTANKQTADGLITLPRDYTGLSRDVPTLGPPLPGDLGRPIRNAQLNGLGEPGIDAEQQRVAQETVAARTSRLFATTHAREHPTPVTLPMSAATEQGPAIPGARGEGPPLDADSLLNMQDRKRAFLTAPVDRKTVSPDRLADPASRYVVQAGAIIPARRGAANDREWGDRRWEKNSKRYSAVDCRRRGITNRETAWCKDRSGGQSIGRPLHECSRCRRGSVSSPHL